MIPDICDLSKGFLISGIISKTHEYIYKFLYIRDFQSELFKTWTSMFLKSCWITHPLFLHSPFNLVLQLVLPFLRLCKLIVMFQKLLTKLGYLRGRRLRKVVCFFQFSFLSLKFYGVLLGQAEQGCLMFKRPAVQQ